VTFRRFSAVIGKNRYHERFLASRGTKRPRISLTIGVVVAVVLLGAVGYFIFTAFSTVKGMVGFDPNRPIPSDDVLKARLTKEQYHVVREGGTETPFHNAYWNNEARRNLRGHYHGRTALCLVRQDRHANRSTGLH